MSICRGNISNTVIFCKSRVSDATEVKTGMMLSGLYERLGVEETCRTEDDQQSGEQLPSGFSPGMHDQLYAVTDL